MRGHTSRPLVSDGTSLIVTILMSSSAHRLFGMMSTISMRLQRAFKASHAAPAFTSIACRIRRDSGGRRHPTDGSGNQALRSIWPQ